MKKNVCFCIDSLRTGGAERLLVDLVNNWNRGGDIYVCILGKQNDFSELIDYSKIKLFCSIGGDTRWQTVIRTIRFCRTNRMGTVNTHLEHSNKCFGLGARLAGCKVFSTVHSVGIYESAPFLRRALALLFYRIFPRKVIAISPAVRDYLLDFGISRDRLVLIENGVDILRIRAKYSSNKVTSGLSLVFCGRLEMVKGLDILLEALALVNTCCHDWTLDLVGDGSERANLERTAKELTISNNIRFHGMQKEPLKFVCDKTLFCMPSRREGLPIALLEALALGIPAIVTNIGYLPELVRDGYNGFVVPTESPEELANKIIEFSRLSLEDRLEYSLRAQESAQKYDIRRCVEKYEETFGGV